MGTQQIIKKELDTFNKKRELLTSEYKVLNKIDEDKVDTSTSNYLDENVISSYTNEQGIKNNLNNRTKQVLTTNTSSDKNTIMSDYYIEYSNNVLDKK